MQSILKKTISVPQADSHFEPKSYITRFT